MRFERHAGEDFHQQPLVLADLGRVTRAATDGFAPRQRKRLHCGQVTTRAIGLVLFADFDPARTARHDGERTGNQDQDDDESRESHTLDCIDTHQESTHL